MTVIFEIVVFVLIIVLIIGLIKPAFVLPWSCKPSRLKVFGYWILAIFIVGVIGTLTESDADRAKTKIETAQKNIEEKNYSEAISNLSDIDNVNPLYAESQRLLHKADSLNKRSEEQKQVAKDNEIKNAAETDKLKQREQLEREIKSITDGIDFSIYRGTAEDLAMELELFASWAKIIKDNDNSNDSEIQNLTKQFKSYVVNLQIKEFPKLRKECASIAAKTVWEDDIEVYTSGTGNSCINFTGGTFAANKNKQEFQNQLHEMLKMFRFGQSRYRWYKGEDEYTYYAIYEGKDSELVVLNNL